MTQQIPTAVPVTTHGSVDQSIVAELSGNDGCPGCGATQSVQRTRGSSPRVQGVVVRGVRPALGNHSDQPRPVAPGPAAHTGVAHSRLPDHSPQRGHAHTTAAHHDRHRQRPRGCR